MRRLKILWLSFVFIATPLFAQIPDIVGDWQGVLKVSGLELRLVFHITQAENGAFRSTMDSPDQGAKGIPVNHVQVNGDSVRLEVAAARGVFLGAMDREAPAIKGVWRQSGHSLELTLKPMTEANVRRRPQTPVAPFPYQAEDVCYLNESSGYELAGTLTLPRGEGAFPAVILITGSGAQDRNETLFEHQPFWVIADHLTRHGIAVLRVDDRGVGGSKGHMATATTTDFATDVEAGMAYLKSRPEIDTSKIGLMGHSEGGIIAPMVAARSEEVAFIILLAGTGLTGEEILYLQSALIIQAGGGTEAEVQSNRKTQEALFSVIKNNPDRDACAAELYRVMQSMEADLPGEKRRAPGEGDTYIKGQIRQMNSPWFRYFLDYDPAPALQNLHCPVLALFGGKDLQVPADENWKAMESAFVAGGHGDYTLKILPNLNHLFQNAETGAPSEYGKIEETFSEEALAIITEWIEQRI